VAGPSYETPAEIRAFQRWGADAVGMSTVPEALVARQQGLAVAGLSCITNVAAGLGRGPITHAEVLAQGEQVREKARALLQSFIILYAQP
jgi:purine-nucleoside phosphorylase